MNDKALAKLPEPKNQGAVEIIARSEALMNAVPSTMDKDRFMSLMVSFANTKAIADCTWQSVVMCAFGCAQLGLIPNPVLQHIAIIPRKTKTVDNRYENRASLMMQYRGYIELARRGGLVTDVCRGVVFEGDEFEQWADEHGKHFRHVPKVFDHDMNKATHVWATNHIVGSPHPMCEIVPRVQVMKSKAKGGDVWKYDEYPMWLKTGILRLSSLWPMSPELGTAQQLDYQIEMGQPQQLPEMPAGLIDAPTAPPANPNQIGSLLGDDEQPGPHDTSQYREDQADDSAPVVDDNVSDADLDKALG